MDMKKGLYALLGTIGFVGIAGCTTTATAPEPVAVQVKEIQLNFELSFTWTERCIHRQEYPDDPTEEWVEYTVFYDSETDSFSEMLERRVLATDADWYFIDTYKDAAPRDGAVDEHISIMYRPELVDGVWNLEAAHFHTERWYRTDHFDEMDIHGEFARDSTLASYRESLNIDGVCQGMDHPLIEFEEIKHSE